MSLRESAREEERAMGCRPDRRQDERLPLAQAGARRAVRVPRVDRRESFAAHAVRRSAGRQTAEGGTPRIAGAALACVAQAGLVASCFGQVPMSAFTRWRLRTSSGLTA